MTKITNDIYYVGVNDHEIDLFEGQYVVPNGMAYNSYLVKDKLVTIFDTVDKRFFNQWIANIKEVLGDQKPDFLIVQHMEPDHSANIENFLNIYPDTIVVSNVQAFKMMSQFFPHKTITKKMVVNDNGTLNTGNHIFHFVFAPMVHWPEVMVTYESTDKVLFSADGFGKFGARDVDEEWDCEARRYYFGIVGKYGIPVQNLLKKASTLDIKIICPLHGPILTENLSHYLSLYDTWSSYRSETEGVAIFYTSVYGHTKEAVEKLVKELEAQNVKKIAVTDLARGDMAEAVEDAFRYPTIVLASTTYNTGVFPFMEDFCHRLVERNFQNKNIAIIENGSWAPNAAKTIKNIIGEKNINYLPIITILSSMTSDTEHQLKQISSTLKELSLIQKLEENKVATPLKPKRKWQCKICGYIYEGEELPDDFKCPLCKHAKEDFVEIN